jgi:hypothetical protein
MVPHYSTDIAAAWQVVEWAIEKGYDVEIAIDNDGAEVLFHASRCEGETALARELATSEAICRAFLASMGAQAT